MIDSRQKNKNQVHIAVYISTYNGVGSLNEYFEKGYKFISSDPKSSIYILELPKNQK